MSRNYSSTAVDTTLTSSVTSGDTSIVVGSTTGLPAPPFTLTLDTGAALQELVLVTAVGGTTLTVTRGYDSTVAVAHNAGAVVSHAHAAIDFREAGATKDAYDTHAAATTAHDATGGVVGATKTQTLTNKTLALGNNSVSGTKAELKAAVTDDDPVFAGDLEWADYVPTLTNMTIGNGTVAARWIQVGKDVRVHIYISIGSTTSITGQIQVSLPVNSYGTRSQSLLCRVYPGVGVAQYMGYAITSAAIGADRVALSKDSGPIDSLPAGSNFDINGAYEAA